MKSRIHSKAILKVLGHVFMATFAILLLQTSAYASNIDKLYDGPGGNAVSSLNTTSTDLSRNGALVFEDQNFANAICDALKKPRGSDIYLNEVKDIEDLDVSGHQIRSLKGIEYFTGLKNLWCNSNQLTSLDISQNTKLEYLNCENNEIASLHIPSTNTLVEINCSSNKLAGFDLSGAKSLVSLYCQNNELSSLDISQNTMLSLLSCYKNKLTALNLSTAKQLSYLTCDNNQLTSLDVSQNTKLRNINCSYNQLSSLDVTGLKLLNTLQCTNNKLSSLKLANENALNRLHCGYNDLTALDISKEINVKYLRCQQNYLSSTADIIGLNEDNLVEFIFYKQKEGDLPQKSISIDGRILIYVDSVPEENSGLFNPGFSAIADVPMEITLYVASYDSGGKLLHCNYLKLSLDADISANIQASIPSGGNAHTYEFFIWDTDYTPLTSITSVKDL